MISGSVRLWHWLESLLTLEQVGYRSWLGVMNSRLTLERLIPQLSAI